MELQKTILFDNPAGLDSKSPEGIRDLYWKFEPMQRTTSFSDHSSPKNESWDERDKLVWETEIRAFHSILPLLPKPCLALGAGSGILAQALNLPGKTRGERKLRKMTRAPRIPVIFTLCLTPSPALFLKECHHLLRPEGKILIGFIPRESPWGRFYMETQKGRRLTHRWGQLYSLKKMEHMMMDAGFSIQGYFSTLFQKPGAVKVLENPMRGYLPQAGFLIIMGERMN